METKDLIQTFFDNNSKQISVSYRYLLLFELFVNLKSHGIIRKDLNEECGHLLMSILTPAHLSGSAKLNFEIFLLCDIKKYMGLVFDSKSGFEKKKIKARQPVPINKEKDKDVIKTKDSETIKIDKSEMKDKEFDMDLLKELGIDVEDLK